MQIIDIQKHDSPLIVDANGNAMEHLASVDHAASFDKGNLDPLIEVLNHVATTYSANVSIRQQRKTTRIEVELLPANSRSGGRVYVFTEGGQLLL